MGTMTAPTSTKKAAILIVNGGETPKDDRWIRLCLDRIARYTNYPDYRIYLWNNRIGAPELDAWFLGQPHLTLLSAASYEKLHHPHRTPLQRLYHLAQEEGAAYIVALDSDAHPLRAGWLTELLAALDKGAALAGVWRDEMVPAIRPHVHASCLCTTVDFIERHQLRFDFDNTHCLERTDTLAHFTWVAEAQGLSIHKLTRSNRRAFHYWMGGIYGDLIYHHVAASRERVNFHNSSQGLVESNQRRYLRDTTATYLFSDYDSYLGWLRGEDAPPGRSALFDQLETLTANAAHGREPEQVLKRWKGLLLSQFRKGSNLRAWKKLIRGHLQKIPVVDRLLIRLVRRIRRPRSEISLFVANPLKMEDLATTPEHGWTSEKPPDFVGIGSPKAGTTWWHALLLDHPQVVPSRAGRKELHYFVHFQHSEMTPAQVKLYQQTFPTPPGAVSGEFSPTYLAYPHCIKHLAAAAPETKIIIILRNPVDRFISHLNHLKWGPRRQSMARTMSEQQLNVYDTFSCYSEATLHSLYSIGLAHFFRYFDRKQVLILQFERSILDPAGELARTYSFLGVDNRYMPDQLTAPRNVLPYVIAKPSPQERARLTAYFADDVVRTCELCPEIDLSLWPEFQHLI